MIYLSDTTNLPESVPIFPLAGALLLPKSRLPLNIFEPKYLKMLEDVLGSPHRLIGMIGGDADHPGVFRGLDAEQGDIVSGDLHAVIAHGKGGWNYQKTLVSVHTLEPLEGFELVVRDQLELFIRLKPKQTAVKM